MTDKKGLRLAIGLLTKLKDITKSLIAARKLLYVSTVNYILGKSYNTK
jgi:hypothetical protein